MKFYQILRQVKYHGLQDLCFMGRGNKQVDVMVRTGKSGFNVISQMSLDEFEQEISNLLKREFSYTDKLLQEALKHEMLTHLFDSKVVFTNNHTGLYRFVCALSFVDDFSTASDHSRPKQKPASPLSQVVHDENINISKDAYAAHDALLAFTAENFTLCLSKKERAPYYEYEALIHPISSGRYQLFFPPVSVYARPHQCIKG